MAGRGVLGMVSTAVAVVFAFGVLAGCGGDDDDGTSGAGDGAAETTTTTVSQDDAREAGEPVRFGAEVYEDPAAHLGEEVTVSGEIVDVLADSAFRIGDNDRNLQPLTIVAARGIEPEGAEGRDDDLVKVTGRVEELDLAALRDEHGLDYDAGRFAPFVGQPAVVASSVEWLEGAAPRQSSG